MDPSPWRRECSRVPSGDSPDALRSRPGGASHASDLASGASRRPHASSAAPSGAMRKNSAGVSTPPPPESGLLTIPTETGATAHSFTCPLTIRTETLGRRDEVHDDSENRPPVEVGGQGAQAS